MRTQQRVRSGLLAEQAANSECTILTVIHVESLVIFACVAFCMGEIEKSVIAWEVSLLQATDKDHHLPFSATTAAPFCKCSHYKTALVLLRAFKKAISRKHGERKTDL